MAIKDDAARADALMRCLGELYAVTLDGKPLANLRYDAGSDPHTNRPALVAMIDVRALAPGRHELRVARSTYITRKFTLGPVIVLGSETKALPDKPADEQEDEDTDVDVIPFWR